MKKSILTIGLFSLVMILTSFTTPETVSATNVESNSLIEITGTQSASGAKKLDITGTQSASGAKKLDITGTQSASGAKKLD